MKTALQNSNEVTKKLIRESERQRAAIFGEQLLRFRHSIDISEINVLGKLDLGKFAPSPMWDSTYRRANVNAFLQSRNIVKNKNLSLQYVSENRFFLAYLNAKKTILVFDINENNEIVFSSDNLIPDLSILSFHMFCANNYAFFVIKTDVPFGNSDYIYVFDRNLTFLKKCSFNGINYIMYVCGEGNTVYIFHKSWDVCYITTFNVDLVIESSVKVRFGVLFKEMDFPYYKIRVLNGFAYFLLNTDLIICLNVKTGEIVRSLVYREKIDSFGIFNDEMILLDEQRQRLSVYDLNGFKKRTIDLNTDTRVDTILSSNSNFCLLNFDEFVFYSLLERNSTEFLN